jgi:hypothetical protein
MTTTQWEVTHLSLDPARVASATTRYDFILQNFFENPFMKRYPRLRGE